MRVGGSLDSVKRSNAPTSLYLQSLHNQQRGGRWTLPRAVFLEFTAGSKMLTQASCNIKVCRYSEAERNPSWWVQVRTAAGPDQLLRFSGWMCQIRGHPKNCCFSFWCPFKPPQKGHRASKKQATPRYTWSCRLHVGTNPCVCVCDSGTTSHLRSQEYAM